MQYQEPRIALTMTVRTIDKRTVDEAYRVFPDKVEPCDDHPAGKIIVDNGPLRYAFLEGARFALNGESER